MWEPLQAAIPLALWEPVQPAIALAEDRVGLIAA
jgi:hypothetical protein